MTSWTPPSVPRKAGRLAALGYQLPTEEQLREKLVSLQVAGGDGLVMSPMVLFALALVVIMVTRLLDCYDCYYILLLVITVVIITIYLYIIYNVIYNITIGYCCSLSFEMCFNLLLSKNH